MTAGASIKPCPAFSEQFLLQWNRLCDSRQRFGLIEASTANDLAGVEIPAKILKEMIGVLNDMVQDDVGGCSVLRWTLRPWPYTSSFPVQYLTVVHCDKIASVSHTLALTYALSGGKSKASLGQNIKCK